VLVLSESVDAAADREGRFDDVVVGISFSFLVGWVVLDDVLRSCWVRLLIPAAFLSLLLTPHRIPFVVLPCWDVVGGTAALLAAAAAAAAAAVDVGTSVEEDCSVLTAAPPLASFGPSGGTNILS